MEIIFAKAELCDMQDLVQLRLDYLQEDYGTLSVQQIDKIKEQLPSYFAEHLNRDLFVYTARKTGIIACCFLFVTEKPANPGFMNGKVGTLLNVYTKPEYRRKGIAGKLMERLLADAKAMGLDFVELKATEDGYYLYKTMGFEEISTKYRNMKLVLSEN